MPNTPSLPTALQREREAWKAMPRATLAESQEEFTTACDRVNAAIGATDQALAALEERDGQFCADCANVAASGVEHDDARLGYVTIQLDRATWRALRALYGREA